MVTTAFVFDHRNRTPKGKEGSIEIRVTIDRKVYYSSTGIKVLKNHFKHGLIIDRCDCEELNERLDFIKRKAEKIINRCIEEKTQFDLSSLRKSILLTDNMNHDNKCDFLEWVSNQIPLLDVAPGRRKHFVTLLSRLYEFNNIKSWEDLSVENIYLFDKWLHSLTKPLTKSQKILQVEPEHLDQSTIYGYHKNLKALLNRAYKMRLINSIDDVPYTRLKGEFSKGDKENMEYLTDDEMLMICNLHPATGTELELARDLFVIQMYTGLSYSDMQTMNLDNYKKIRGKWVNNGQRIKTGVPFVSHLLPPVVEVLSKYNWSVPQMSMQHYNESLKVIGRTLGIPTRMHSHLARHTFATYMLRNGVKVENLARMLGHKNIKQTMRYSKVLAESVHDDFEMIEKKLNYKTIK